MSRGRRNLGFRLQTMIDEVLHLLQGENQSSVSPCAQSVQLLKLEDRLLMSVTPMAVVADSTTVATATVVQESPAVVADAGDGLFAPDNAFSVESSMVLSASKTEDSVNVGSNQELVNEVTSDVELIVIDSAVEDADTLLSLLLATDRTFRILRLDPEISGLEQITQRLEELGGAQAIHLLTHGSPGEVRLGSTSLNSATLASHAAELLAWQNMLTSEADILLYGCNVAGDVNGEEFLEALSCMTAADVAGSNDATGAAEFGGDWILEDRTGAVETSIAFDHSQLVGWHHILAAPVAGSQFLLNQETTNTQHTLGEDRGSQNAVAVDQSGNFVVAWTSRNQDRNRDGVFVRRFSADGASLFNEIQVNQTIKDDQRHARVASDRDGNFVVTWSDAASGGTVYARLFRADGTPVTNEFVVNVTSAGTQSDPSVAMNANGDFIVGWQGNGPGDTDGAFFRRFDRFGNALNAYDVQPFASLSSPASQVSVAIAEDGNAVLVCDNSTLVQYRRISSSGTVVGTEGFIFGTTDPAIAMKPNGEFIMAVKDNLDGAIKTQWYLADGTAVGARHVISGAALADPSISVAPDGSYLLTWTGTDSNGSGIYAQRFDSARNAIDFAFLVNQQEAGSQLASSVAASTSLDYMVVWSGAGTEDSSGVYGRVYSDSTPRISSLGDQLFNEDSTEVVSFRVTDGDTPLSNLILHVSSSNGALFTSGGLVLGGTGRDRTLTLTPVANAFGSSVITLTVNDGTAITTTTFLVDVLPVNDAPVAAADSFIVSEDSTLSVSGATSWYDSNWKWRQQVTFKNSGAVIVDEAVLITLTAGTFDYRKAGSLGQDLRFVDADGTLLKYEIESWNPDGVSKIWVRVPLVDANSTSDRLWMYFGNPAATDAQDLVAVWGSSASVMHLHGSTLTDSAANGGTVVQSGSTAVPGLVGQGRQFDGVSGSVELQGTAVADDIFRNGGTVSAWIYATGWADNDFGRIADKASVTFAGLLGNGWTFQLTSTGRLLFEHGFTVGTGVWMTNAASISLNQWTHVAVTYDSSSVSNTPRIFINGIEVSVITSSSAIGVAGSDSGINLTIGNFAGDDSRTFNGIIDEFRLSTDTMTPAEINAAYRATLAGIASLGSQERREAGVLLNDSDVEDNPMTAVLVSGPGHAQSFTFNSDGSFTYVPQADYSGTDTFTYQALDGTDASAITTVTLTVTAVNDAPRVTGQSLSTFTGRAIQVTAPGLMRGATDVEGDAVSLLVSRGPSNGTLQWLAGGAFVYTPNEGYFGTDSFDFSGTDGIDTGAVATVVITVKPGVSRSTGSSASNTTSNSSTNQTQTQQVTIGTTSGTTGGSSPGWTGTTGGSNTTGNTSNGNGGAAANNVVTAGGTSSSAPVGFSLTTGVSVDSESGEQETVVAMLVASASEETAGSSLLRITSDPSDSDTSDRLDVRRFSSDVSSLQARLDLLGRPLDDSFRRLQEQREDMYQAVASRAHEQTGELKKELREQVAARGRVVGSVSVVTTGFSVGYLLYLVRGGMLLSGLLTQIPTWSMLDPLMVIDGVGRDDDKESLESIMDREQARLQSQAAEKSAEEAKA